MMAWMAFDWILYEYGVMISSMIENAHHNGSSETNFINCK